MNPTQSDYQLTDVLDVPEIAPLPAIRSERAATVAKWFGIDDRLNPSKSAADSPPDQRTDRALLRSLLPRAGQIVFLTGPSGAGKSSMLRALRGLRSRARWRDLNAIALPDTPLVDCFDGAPLDQTLALLSQVGLAEAWSYLRTPGELSEGQRWRLKLALSMHHSIGAPASAGTEIPGTCRLKAARRLGSGNRVILLADEFAALLDRITAAIVARCLRRAISTTPTLCAIVATSHHDLTAALQPDVIVNCDFRRIEVHRRGRGGFIVRKDKPKKRKRGSSLNIGSSRANTQPSTLNKDRSDCRKHLPAHPA